MHKCSECRQSKIFRHEGLSGEECGPQECLIINDRGVIEAVAPILEEGAQWMYDMVGKDLFSVITDRGKAYRLMSGILDVLSDGAQAWYEDEIHFVGGKNWASQVNIIQDSPKSAAVFFRFHQGQPYKVVIPFRTHDCPNGGHTTHTTWRRLMA